MNLYQKAKFDRIQTKISMQDAQNTDLKIQDNLTYSEESTANYEEVICRLFKLSKICTDLCNLDSDKENLNDATEKLLMNKLFSLSVYRKQTKNVSSIDSYLYNILSELVTINDYNTSKPCADYHTAVEVLQKLIAGLYEDEELAAQQVKFSIKNSNQFLNKFKKLKKYISSTLSEATNHHNEKNKLSLKEKIARTMRDHKLNKKYYKSRESDTDYLE